MVSLKKIGLLACLTVLVGCTRPQENSAPVSFSVPMKKLSSQNSSSSSSVLTYAAVNVSGDKMDKIICSYDHEIRSSQGGCKFNANEAGTTLDITIDDVTNGDGRLFQVLLAYDTSTGGSVSFKYAEGLSRVPADGNSLTLTLQDIGGTQGGGKVYGRYLDGSGSGPTDIVNVVMTPKEGSPSMVIQQAEMYAGWFRAFALETTTFDYILKTSQVSIFTQPMNKSTFTTKAGNSSGAMMVDGVSDFNVWGFFGSSTATTGKTASMSACGGTEFTSCLSKDAKFTGPFRQNASSGLMLDVLTSPDRVRWALLPGVDSTVMDSVSVYVSPTDLTDAQLSELVMSRGFNCAAYADASKYPLVQKIGEVSVTGTQSQTTTGPHVPNPKRPLVICPKVGGVLKTAAIVSPQLDNDGGCSDCKYFRFELTSPALSQGDSYKAPANSCVPVTVRIFKGHGISSDASVATSFVWSNPSWGSLYTSSDCISGAISNPTISFSASSHINNGSYYVKTGSTAMTGQQITATSYSGEQPQITFSPQYNLIDILQTSLGWDAPSTVLMNACYQVAIGAYMGGDTLVPSLGTALSVSVSASSDTKFYSTAAQCASDISGTVGTYSGYSIWSPNPGNPIWMKKPTATAFTVSSSAPGYTEGVKSIAIGSGNAQLVSFKMDYPSPMTVGVCTPVAVIAVNENGVETPITDAVTVRLGLTAGNGEFYSTSGCYSALGGSMGPEITINAGDSRARVYFRTSSNTTIAFYMSAGMGVDSIGNSATAPVTIPSGLNYATLQPPNLPATVMGSHNFPIAMAVTSNISGIKCYRYSSSPNWADDGTCSSQFNLSTKVFSWSATSAASDMSSSYRYYFGTQTDYYNSIGAHFNPAALYKSNLNMPLDTSEQGLRIVDCAGVVINADGVNDFATINAALTSNPVVCLGRGTSSTFAGTVGTPYINMPSSGKTLVGWLDPTTNYARAIILQGYPEYSVVKVVASSSIISIVSNFIINKPASSSTVSFGIQALGTSPSQSVKSYNNFYALTGGAVSGGGITTPGTAISSVGDVFNVASVSSGPVYGFESSAGSTSHRLFAPTFNLLSNASTYSIAISNSANSVSNTVRMVGAAISGSGVAILGSASNSSYPALTTCHQCKINLAANAYAGAAMGGVTGLIPNIMLTTYAKFQIFESQWVNAEDSPMVYFDGSPSNTYSLVEVQSSVINQLAAASFAKLPSTYTPRFVFQGSHFYSAVGSQYAIQGTPSPYLYVDTAVSAGYGNNVFCGADASNKWNPALFQASIFSSGQQFTVPASILTTSNLRGSLRLCQGTHAP